MEGRCHCGRVTIRVPGPPDYLNECNCTLCWRLGTMWGYYPASEVEFAGERQAYARSDLGEQRLAADFCPHCGATTNWRALLPDAPDRMGVNMKLFDPAALAGIELRSGDRLNGDGSGPRRTYREAAPFDGAGARS